MEIFTRCRKVQDGVGVGVGVSLLLLTVSVKLMMVGGLIAIVFFLMYLFLAILSRSYVRHFVRDKWLPRVFHSLIIRSRIEIPKFQI